MENCEFSLKPTNSFISGAFDILKTQGAIEDPGTDHLSAMMVDMEESYFLPALSFLKEMNESVTNNKIILYKAIAESAEEVTVLESFSDYYTRMYEIAEKSLKFLREKLDAFYAHMNNFIDGNEEIKMNRSKLEDISHYESDGLDGFIYTCDDDTIPDMRAFDLFNASLFDKLFKPMVSDFNADSVRRIVNDEQLEEDYALFRAKLLGQDKPMSEYEFTSQLYSIFRNGESHARQINPDTNMLKRSIEKWFKFSMYKSILDRQYKELKDSLESVMDKISKICKNNNGLTISAFVRLLPGDIQVKSIDGKNIDTEGSPMSGEMMIQLDIYCNAKITQLIKYTDFVIMAMTMKIDSIAKEYDQLQRILMDALDIAVKHPENYEDNDYVRKHILPSLKEKIDGEEED